MGLDVPTCGFITAGSVATGNAGRPKTAACVNTRPAFGERMTDYDDDSENSIAPDYTDPEYLRQRYYRDEWPMREIADECGVSTAGIQYQMEKHGLPRTRGRGTTSKYANFRTDNQGYEEWSVYDRDKGNTIEFRVHRLLAVAEYGFDAVANHVVHHGVDPDAPCPLGWANWPANIELQTRGEHINTHRPDREYAPPDHAKSAAYRDPEWLHEQYVEKGRSQTDIADECGVDKWTVRYWLIKHGIGKYRGDDLSD